MSLKDSYVWEMKSLAQRVNLLTQCKQCRVALEVDQPLGSSYSDIADRAARSTNLWADISCLQWMSVLSCHSKANKLLLCQTNGNFQNGLFCNFFFRTAPRRTAASCCPPTARMTVSRTVTSIFKRASHFPGRRSSSSSSSPSPPPTLKWYFKKILTRQENPSKTRFYLFVWLLLSKLLLVFVVVRRRRRRRRRRRCRFFDHCARMEKNVLLYIFVSADVCVATVVLVLVWLCQSMVCLVLEDFIFQC